MELLDAFKVENVARILGGNFSFSKPNQLKYFQFIFPWKPKNTEVLDLRGTVMGVLLFSDLNFTEIATYDLYSCQNMP